ncbi:MAG: Pr6Pr family membrane protein [Candidatus Coproplasma sp.]
MVKNVSIRLLFQTVYCVLAAIGLISSLGYFNGEFRSEFYVMYTNLSNYVCMGFMAFALVKTFKKALKKEDGTQDLAPAFKFACNIMILVTFLVYNILLAKEKSASDYFLSIGNLTMHLILPIMFIVDWILFYDHGKTKWYYPLLCVIMPAVYLVFIFVRAAILPEGTTATVYPYFFLNVDKIGVGGVVGWICALVAVFVFIGYIFYAADNSKRIIGFFKSRKKSTADVAAPDEVTKN